MRYKNLFYLSVPVAAKLIYSLSDNEAQILQAAELRMELEQVQVVFRHGARTPTSWTTEKLANFQNLVPQNWDKNVFMCGEQAPEFDIPLKIRYKNGEDPSGAVTEHLYGKKIMKGDCANGELTLIGQKQLFELGKLLHEKYISSSFISSTYNSEEVYVRTSYYRRTIQSLTALLAGFYGKENLTDPVNVVTKVIKDEDLYGNTHACPKFKKWFLHNVAGGSAAAEEEQYRQHLNKLLGKKENAKESTFTSVNDLIRCRETHGLSVPQYLLDNRDTISKYELDLMNRVFGKGRLNILRCNIGSVVDTICNAFRSDDPESTKHKLVLYSAHDWTIFSLLIAFGVDVKEFPKFGSNIILELYKREDGERFIRLLLNDQVVLLGKQGDEYLPLEQFLELVKSCRVQDFHKECELETAD